MNVLSLFIVLGLFYSPFYTEDGRITPDFSDKTEKVDRKLYLDFQSLWGQMKWPSLLDMYAVAVSSAQFFEPRGCDFDSQMRYFFRRSWKYTAMQKSDFLKPVKGDFNYIFFTL